MTEQSVQQDKSAVDYVVGRIVAMLTSMELMPGARIRQEMLAAKLDVSRAPIREALRVLQSQGLVEQVPNAGYSVRRLTRSELTQVYLMRELLEAELVRRALPADDDLVRDLSELNAEMAAAADREDIPHALSFNKAFHFRLYRGSGLDLVVSEVERLWTQTDAYRAYSSYDPASIHRSTEDHEQIIEALRGGEPEAVIAALNAHREIPGRLLQPILAAE